MKPNAVDDGAQQFDQLVVKGQANLLGGTIAFFLIPITKQAARMSNVVTVNPTSATQFFRLNKP